MPYQKKMIKSIGKTRIINWNIAARYNPKKRPEKTFMRGGKNQ